MAYNLKQISPLDLKPSTAIGVKLPFQAPSVFTSVYTTKEQIKYNLINFLLTDRNERPFSPNFGAGLRSYLFEQISNESLDSLEATIQSKIEDNFPNIIIKTLDVIGNPNYSTINIKFSYVLKNTNENDSVIITIQNS